MKPKLASAVVAVVFGAVSIAGTVSAGAGTVRAETTVTIRTQNGDFWGYVNSPRPKKCADGRKIVLFKQVGAEQDPRVDQRIADDTASLSGDRYEWNTGNTGKFGKFYARAGKTENCKGDTSKTIRSVRT